jgi:hypothetical protein
MKSETIAQFSITQRGASSSSVRARLERITLEAKAPSALIEERASRDLPVITMTCSSGTAVPAALGDFHSCDHAAAIRIVGSLRRALPIVGHWIRCAAVFGASLKEVQSLRPEATHRTDCRNLSLAPLALRGAGNSTERRPRRELIP